MRVASDMFGAYHLMIYGGGVSVTITAPDGREVHLQGEDAASLVDEYEDAARDIAGEPNATRWARIGERAAADEIFGVYFD